MTRASTLEVGRHRGINPRTPLALQSNWKLIGQHSVPLVGTGWKSVATKRAAMKLEFEQCPPTVKAHRPSRPAVNFAGRRQRAYGTPTSTRQHWPPPSLAPTWTDNIS